MTPPAPPPTPTPTTHKPWWQQRGRVFAVGLILLVLGSALGLLIGAWFTLHQLKNSPAYQAAVHALQNHPDAQTHLGRGIQPGTLVMGQVHQDLGHADLMFSASGDRAKAGVRARVERIDGQWQVTYLDLGLGDRDTGQTVTLIGKQPPQP